MRFLVISDIHANATALTAALAVAEGRWERAICLGDVVGYGPDPNEVIDRVRGLVAAIIRGNHDKAASGLGDLEDLNPVARAAVEWTRAQLRPENLRLPHGTACRPARIRRPHAGARRFAGRGRVRLRAGSGAGQSAGLAARRHLFRPHSLSRRLCLSRLTTGNDSPASRRREPQLSRRCDSSPARAI